MNRDGIYVPSLFVNILKLCLILCNTIHCFIVNYKIIIIFAFGIEGAAQYPYDRKTLNSLQ